MRWTPTRGPKDPWTPREGYVCGYLVNTCCPAPPCDGPGLEVPLPWALRLWLLTLPCVCRGRCLHRPAGPCRGPARTGPVACVNLTSHPFIGKFADLKFLRTLAGGVLLSSPKEEPRKVPPFRMRWTPTRGPKDPWTPCKGYVCGYLANTCRPAPPYDGAGPEVPLLLPLPCGLAMGFALFLPTRAGLATRVLVMYPRGRMALPGNKEVFV